MTKHLVIIVFVALTVSVFSQKQQNVRHDYPIDQLTAKASYHKVLLDSANFNKSAADYLYRTVSHLKEPNVSVVLDTLIQSPAGKHLTYHQYFKNIKIDGAQLKVNIGKNGETTSVFDRSVSTDAVQGSVFPETQILENYFIHPPLVLKTELVWYYSGKGLIAAIKGDYSPESSTAFTVILDHTGQVLYEKDLSLYFNQDKDSLVSGIIFNPDPLSRAQVQYGGSYVDNNDSDVPDLNNQRDTVSFIADYDTVSQIFSLRSPYVLITDHSIPTVAPATSTNGEFYYSRSQSGFEDVNVFYHINTFQQYIRNLGFTNIVNYPVEIDTHGLNGSDNSTFLSFNTPPRISFGEGGVDDAEDADVIIHEYTHAIMHSAAPNTNSGTERQALDEANGDYFAASYSRSKTEFRWEEVYTWDGHNEFWNGRFATTSDQYPEDLQNDLYEDADIWSSTIMKIWEEVGRETTDKILLQSAYSYTSGMSMADAAQLFYDADVAINNGINFWPICGKFVSRGLMATCPVGIEDNHLVNFQMDLINTSGFAKGSENAIIRFNQPEIGTVHIYTIDGKLLRSFEFNQPEIKLSPDHFKAGVYLISVNTNGAQRLFKLMRY